MLRKNSPQPLHIYLHVYLTNSANLDEPVTFFRELDQLLLIFEFIHIT